MGSKDQFIMVWGKDKIDIQTLEQMRVYMEGLDDYQLLGPIGVQPKEPHAQLQYTPYEEASRFDE